VGELGARLGAADGVEVARLGDGEGDFNEVAVPPPHAVTKTTTAAAPTRILMQEG
jgi:hypothetical protein